MEDFEMYAGVYLCLKDSPRFMAAFLGKNSALPQMRTLYGPFQQLGR